MPTAMPSDTQMPTAQSPDYEVLVCTYNGAAYITEQLNSIGRQIPAPTRILVSDDGSSDQTLALVEQIAATSKIPVQIIQGPGKGIVHNVFHALPMTRASYVMLADQDDIWLDNKAQLFCAHMRTSTQPHLIFSDAWVWYPASNQRLSFQQLDGLQPNNSKDVKRLAFHNCIQGASSAINQALIQALKPHPAIAMHDWWLGLIAAGIGQISAIAEPTLLYRQHADNQVGSQRGQTSKRVSLALKKQRAHSVLLQASAFAHCYAEQLVDTEQAFFQAYKRAMTGSVWARAKFLLCYRPQRKNWLRTLTLWASIISIRLSKADTEGASA